MDSFDLKPEKPSRSQMTWNILTVLLLIGIVCLVGYFLMIFTNPYSALNPFQPALLPTSILLPTATITPRQLPPTWTPSPTLEPAATNTLAPSRTPIPTNTLYLVPSPTSRYTPTKTLTPTRTVRPTGMPYSVATPQYLPSTIYHPELGCNWLGVAGSAVDKNNSPILSLVVRVYGTLEGKLIDALTLTGIAPIYSQSGFEVVLSDHPIASSGALWIQLLDQTGLPLTDKIYFDTYQDCNKNLVLFRFTKMR